MKVLKVLSSNKVKGTEIIAITLILNKLVNLSMLKIIARIYQIQCIKNQKICHYVKCLVYERSM